MKKNILFLNILLVILFTMGCSKDDDTTEKESEYYFRYKVEASQQDYKFGNNQTNLIGSHGFDENTATFAINIAGIQKISEPGKNTLSIFVSDTEGFTTGIDYSNIPGEGDEYPDFIFTMGYYDGEGNLYIAGGQGDNPIYADLYEPAFVKFSEITDTYISGTFSGVLIWYDSSQGTNEFIDSVVISEGTFKVPRAL
jgi:hypothetical protein